MPTTLRAFIAFAVNAVAVASGRAHAAWTAATDTAPRELGLQLAVTARPRQWTQVKDPVFTVTLVACNDALATADLAISDGTNTVNLSVARPMWSRGPAAAIALRPSGSFERELREELGVTGRSMTSDLDIDMDAFSLKFEAAALACGRGLRDMTTTIGLCGALTSVSETAERVTLVRVHRNGTFDVSDTTGFPTDLVTSDIVAEVIRQPGTSYIDDASMAARHFPCTDGDVVLVCARNLM
jgi:hypothetical protein